MKLRLRVVCFGLLLSILLSLLLAYVVVQRLRFDHHSNANSHDSPPSRLQSVLPPNQVLAKDMKDASIFSAYYEERPSMLGPSVVVIGYQDKTFNRSLYCFLVFPNGSAVCSPAETRVIDECNRFVKKGYMTEVFYICRLKASGGNSAAVPATIALSQDNSCSLKTPPLSVSAPQNYSSVSSPPRAFGVCLQTPLFKLSSLQVLVDFIEMNRLLGAEMFTMYAVNIGTSLDSKLLTQLKQAYAEEGILEVVELNGVFKRESPLHYYGELLAINDCLYRNMHQSRYLVFQDLDEIIVPRKHTTWQEAIEEMDPTGRKSGYVFKNMYFVLSESHVLERYVHGQQQCKEMRMPLYLKSLNRVKCDYRHFDRSKYIVRPKLIQDLDIHGICTPVKGYWQYYVPGEIGGNFHYRLVIDDSCKSPVSELDLKMANYSTALLSAVGRRICH